MTDDLTPDDLLAFDVEFGDIDQWPEWAGAKCGQPVVDVAAMVREVLEGFGWSAEDITRAWSVPVHREQVAVSFAKQVEAVGTDKFLSVDWWERVKLACTIGLAEVAAGWGRDDA